MTTPDVQGSFFALGGAKLGELSLRTGGMQSLEKARLKETTDEFEALFLSQYLEKSFESNNALFGEGVGSNIYKSMYVDALSKQLGGGLGISQMLVDYLAEQSNLKG